MAEKNIEGSAKVTGKTEGGVSSKPQVHKIALEGGMLQGIVRLKAYREKITISIDDNVHTIVEKYEIKHIDPTISIFKDGNAKFTLVHSERFINDNPGE